MSSACARAYATASALEFAGGIRCTEQSGLSMRCTSKKHSMRRSVLSLVASATVFGVIENLDPIWPVDATVLYSL